jgi:hypothetical protein
MIFRSPPRDDLGFSLNPLHYVKKAAVAAEHGAVAAGKLTVKSVTLPTKYLLLKPTEWLLDKATAPVRALVHKLRDRRAKKLAWDRRKSTTPNAQDQADAKSWTRSKLEHLPDPVTGRILAHFAGPTYGQFHGTVYRGDNLGIAPAVVAAAVPILMGVMKAVLSQFSKSGEAPANPAAGGGGAAAASGGGSPAADGGDAGAADGAGDDGGAASAGGGGGKKHGKGGGGGGGGQILGLPKKYVMIGGAVLGGVLVLSLLTSKKG